MKFEISNLLKKCPDDCPHVRLVVGYATLEYSKDHAAAVYVDCEHSDVCSMWREEVEIEPYI